MLIIQKINKNFKKVIEKITIQKEIDRNSWKWQILKKWQNFLKITNTKKLIKFQKSNKTPIKHWFNKMTKIKKNDYTLIKTLNIF